MIGKVLQEFFLWASGIKSNFLADIFASIWFIANMETSKDNFYFLNYFLRYLFLFILSGYLLIVHVESLSQIYDLYRINFLNPNLTISILSLAIRHILSVFFWCHDFRLALYVIGAYLVLNAAVMLTNISFMHIL